MMTLTISIHRPEIATNYDGTLDIHRNQSGDLVIGLNDSHRHDGLVTVFATDEEFDAIVSAVAEFRAKEVR